MHFCSYPYTCGLSFSDTSQPYKERQVPLESRQDKSASAKCTVIVSPVFPLIFFKRGIPAIFLAKVINIHMRIHLFDCFAVSVTLFWNGHANIALKLYSLWRCGYNDSSIPWRIVKTPSVQPATSFVHCVVLTIQQTVSLYRTLRIGFPTSVGHKGLLRAVGIVYGSSP